MNKQTHKKDLVRAGAGHFALNQHAPRYADKRTKRNRSRGDQKRKAIAENA